MSLIALLAAAIGKAHDVTPSAVDWANLAGGMPQSNAVQQITDIDIPIELRAVGFSSGGAAATATLVAVVGGVDAGQAAIPVGSFGAINFSVSGLDQVNFRIQESGGPQSGALVGTVTVTNQSDGGATLDTFTYNVSN